MDEKMRQEIALHRWAVIAEAANGKLTSSERGAVVRQRPSSPAVPTHRHVNQRPVPPALIARSAERCARRTRPADTQDRTSRADCLATSEPSAECGISLGTDGA
jgi:hypothetical protein